MISDKIKEILLSKDIFLDDRGVAEYNGLVPIMLELVLRTNAKTILEIGTRTGNSARIFASALKHTDGFLFTIDHEFPSWPKPAMCKFHNIGAFRAESLSIKWNMKCDIVFIDGNHSYSGISKDLEKYGKFAKKLILFHDTNHEAHADDIQRAMIKYSMIHNLNAVTIAKGHGLGIIFTRNVSYKKFKHVGGDQCTPIWAVDRKPDETDPLR